MRPLVTMEQRKIIMLTPMTKLQEKAVVMLGRMVGTTRTETVLSMFGQSTT